MTLNNNTANTQRSLTVPAKSVAASEIPIGKKWSALNGVLRDVSQTIEIQETRDTKKALRKEAHKMAYESGAMGYFFLVQLAIFSLLIATEIYNDNQMLAVGISLSIVVMLTLGIHFIKAWFVLRKLTQGDITIDIDHKEVVRSSALAIVSPTVKKELSFAFDDAYLLMDELESDELGLTQSAMTSSIGNDLYSGHGWKYGCRRVSYSAH